MNSHINTQFQSTIGPIIEKFVMEKRACGYQYKTESRILKHFDDYLSGEKFDYPELPRSVTQTWIAKRPHESSRTHKQRVSLVRQLAKFMVRIGHPAYVPESGFLIRDQTSFTPYIFTHTEMQRLLKAVEQLEPTARSPLRHIIMPEIFRLLYGCGFRLGEVLSLRVRDVDLNQGIVTVRQGKMCKDRHVPPALSLVRRLQAYEVYMGNRPPDCIYFPSPNGGSYRLAAPYNLFRKMLHDSGIAHPGRGKGPRVHDIRHTFAVHTLLRWYRENRDIDAKLPLLAAYMGHRKISGTQQYLHLTAELYPDIIKRVSTEFSDVIPRRVKQ